jgi:hypothetical protein
MEQRFTVEERILICCRLLKTESSSQCLRKFRQDFPSVNVPTISAIHKTVDKFESTGLVLNREIKPRRHILKEAR